MPAQTGGFLTSKEYKDAVTATQRLQAQTASARDLTRLLAAAETAAKAFAGGLRDGQETAGVELPLAKAIAALSDRGTVCKTALSVADADLATGDSSILKAIQTAHVEGDDQTAASSAAANLASAQAEYTRSKEGLRKALTTLSAVLGDDAKAIAAMNERSGAVATYFAGTNWDDAALGMTGPNLRSAARLHWAYGNNDALSNAVKGACEGLAKFDTAAENETKLAVADLLTAANAAVEGKKALTDRAIPTKALEAMAKAMSESSQSLSRATAVGASETTNDLHRLLSRATALMVAHDAVLSAASADPGKYPHTKTVVDWLRSTPTLAERKLLSAVVVQARELTEGDYAQFVTDTVSLYYFPDIKRLIYTLNDGTERIDPAQREGLSGGAGALEAKRLAVRTAQREYEVAYAALAEATASFAAKRIDVDDKARLARLASNQFDMAVQQRELASRDYDRSAASVEKAQAQVDAATTAVPPNAARLARAKQQLESAQKESDRRKKILEDRRKKADAANPDTAKAKAANAEDEATDLSQTLGDLSATVTRAAATLRNARFELQTAQDEELKAFAFDRDNKPYYRAPAVAGATDPAHRVVMYAYDDSKVLLIRGRRKDVDQVKDIVAQFDAPTPQARITLWSLDLNVESSRKGRSSLGRVMSDVDLNLLALRQQTSLVARTFRDAVNATVHEVENAKAADFGQPGGMPLDQQRMARLCFFNPEVARRLGFDPEFAPNHQRRYYFSRWTAPDPSGTTTLGEAIMMYSLASDANRTKVRSKFEELLTDRLRKLDDSDPTIPKPGSDDSAKSAKMDKAIKEKVSRLMARLYQLCPSGMQTGSEGLTSEQLEIVNALKRSALEKFIDNAPALCRLYNTFSETLQGGIPVKSVPGRSSTRYYRFGNVSATNERIALPDDESTHTIQWSDYRNGAWIAWEPYTGTEPSAEAAETAYFLWPAFSWLKEEFGLTPETFRQAHLYARNEAAEGSAKGGVADARSDRDWNESYNAHCIEYFRSLYPRSASNARIAAADEMLKVMMVQFEDALDTTFVQPMLKQIRTQVAGDRIDVGQFQRTSLLATNRYVARIAPSASAQLDLAGQTNVLEDAQQLATFATAVQSAQIPAIANALKALPGKEPAPELYALNGKSSFVVTPIFDPSGQALRFQFDYLKTLNIQEPDGTTNPRLPRVDSYPISLPVQISNLELREVTRFEQTARLGVPVKQWGGIPVLNQMRLFRDVPLIGWFSRRDGYAAVSQQTIILAQTATYPTIEDISRLMTGGFELYRPTTTDRKKKSSGD